MEESKVLKIYPWKGLLGLKDKYGVFIDFKNYLHGEWLIRNTYNNPFKLGEEFGRFLSERSEGIYIEPEQNFKENPGQLDVVGFFEDGRIKPLTDKELESFKKGLKKGYPAISD